MCKQADLHLSQGVVFQSTSRSQPFNHLQRRWFSKKNSYEQSVQTSLQNILALCPRHLFHLAITKTCPHAEWDSLNHFVPVVPDYGISVKLIMKLKTRFVAMSSFNVAKILYFDSIFRNIFELIQFFSLSLYKISRLRRKVGKQECAKQSQII